MSQNIYPVFSIPYRTGIVPTPATIANYNRSRMPNEPADRRLLVTRINHEGHYPTLQSVVGNLGLGLEKERSWKSYLSDAIHTSPNAIAFRQSFYAKAREDRLGPQLCRALLLRCSQYARQRAMGKSQGIVTPHDLLAKAGGAGSRGGHIIGHTKSGKAIYGSGHAASYGKVKGHDEVMDVVHVRDAHPDFTAEDHADAAKAHGEHAEAKFSELSDRSRAGGAKGAAASRKAFQKHAAIFTAHERTAKQMRSGIGLGKSGGEGSHGGHIIGHTKSGKPVYGSGHAKYSGVRKIAKEKGGDSPALGVAVMDKHKGFTAQDHRDAKDIHNEAASNEGGTGPVYQAHRVAATAHMHAAHKVEASDRWNAEHGQKSFAKSGAASDDNNDAPFPASYEEIKQAQEDEPSAQTQTAAQAAADLINLLGDGGQEGIGMDDLADIVDQYGPDLMASVLKATIDDGQAKFSNGKFYGIVGKSFVIPREPV